MNVITTTEDLNRFCNEWNTQEFITVDLEFLREHSYYAKLCLIQVGSLKDCAIIDPLAENLNLSPFFELMQNTAVVKVFHSGRQDIEIIYNLSGKIPQPLFDTQIAGMVTGFGESISYENLVKYNLHIELDKSNRLSDWSKRPLNQTQLEYALHDVTHLVHIYEYLRDRLKETGRSPWLAEEMETLSSPDTYVIKPEDAWQRLKHRSHNARFLTLLRELASWREARAQRRNTPRQSFIKDDMLLAIAAACPKTKEELCQIRNLRSDVAGGKLGDEIMEVLEAFSKIPADCYVIPPKEKSLPNANTSLYELLRLLLKIKCQQEGVVPRLIADDDDLRRFSCFKDKNSPILKGWRKEIFGNDALALREGRLTIGYDPQAREIKFL